MRDRWIALYVSVLMACTTAASWFLHTAMLMNVVRSTVSATILSQVAQCQHTRASGSTTHLHLYELK